MLSARYLDTAPTTTTGVARGGPWAMLTKIYKFHVSPFCQFYKKIVLRLSKYGDVIQTEAIKVCLPQTLLAKSVPNCNFICATNCIKQGVFARDEVSLSFYL